MRIVVTGLAATFPYGGVFWDYLQFVLGFHQLGHDALYLEDTGKWCYNPETSTFIETGEENARRLAKNIDLYMPELADKWTFRDGTDQVFGLNKAKTREFCRTADMFIHLSASCIMREEYFEARRVAFVDSDPMYTQAKLAAAEFPESPDHEAALGHLEWLRRHDVFFSFGENVGKPDCKIPCDLIPWQPTRQPITIDRFEGSRIPPEKRTPKLTTVASWNPHEGSIVWKGQVYGGKSIEFERFMDLPNQLALPMELAISGDIPLKRLQENGWNPIDALPVSGDPRVYRDYLANSAGEFSIAKNAYVASNSGWFSCRSAVYLALGVPVVVQDTGFSRHIPTGHGVFAFRDKNEAIAGVEAISSNRSKESEAALEIAREYFDAAKVLGRFIEDATSDPPAASGKTSSEDHKR